MIHVKKWVAVAAFLVTGALGYGIGVGEYRDAQATERKLEEQLHREQSLLRDCVTGPQGERKTLPPLCMYEDC
jgi:hypothetical protein